MASSASQAAARAAASKAMNRGMIVPLALSTAVMAGAVYWSHNHDPRDTIGGASWAYYHVGGAARALLDAEKSHQWAIRALQWGPIIRGGLGMMEGVPDASSLSSHVFGREFSNPIGLAAGFDKDAKVVNACHDLGFGFIEIGSVTPEPQDGNEKPRVFRLPEDNAIINRYGFNSAGHDACRDRLEQREIWLAKRNLHLTLQHQDEPRHRWMGVNLGKNKTSSDAADDYVKGVLKLGTYADYLVINVSSPNTPGLRALQGKQQLMDVLTRVKAARDSLPMPLTVPPPPIRRGGLAGALLPPGATVGDARTRGKSMIEVAAQSVPTAAGVGEVRTLSAKAYAPPGTMEPLPKGASYHITRARPPLLLKIAPDLTDEDKKDIADVCIAVGIDGLIISNTTIARPSSLRSSHRDEVGGLSGAPLMGPSTEVVRDMYIRTQGRVPIIGSGGIMSGRDAYDKIRSGASLVQVYSAFAYGGPWQVKKMKSDLAALLAADGFKHVADAVGVDARRDTRWVTPTPAVASAPSPAVAATTTSS